MNNCNIIVFDFETGGLDVNVCPPIQVAAIALNPRTLTQIPGATFNKMMCPPDDEFGNIQDDALSVNKKTREQIRAAPPEKLVWQEFCAFVDKYANQDGPAIPAGQNICSFDLPISARLCKKYGRWDKKENRQNLWNNYMFIDTLQFFLFWFENNNELKNAKGRRSYSMNVVRPYFGIPSEGAHDALKDVKDTVWLIKKFLKLHRSVAPRVKFAGSYKEDLTNG
jgi:DNA polymerase III epsilon subunit-like protein